MKIILEKFLSSMNNTHSIPDEHTTRKTHTQSLLNMEQMEFVEIFKIHFKINALISLTGLFNNYFKNFKKVCIFFSLSNFAWSEDMSLLKLSIVIAQLIRILFKGLLNSENCRPFLKLTAVLIKTERQRSGRPANDTLCCLANLKKTFLFGLNGSARSPRSAGSEPQTGRDGRPRWPLFGRGFFCLNAIKNKNSLELKFSFIPGVKAGK
ncbi:hypothetical protein BpHYR1_026453 [Brachionus plicatilis]|uniref:Uncharacterized protein n=1 Tax=Brachionus plicatilis TaxID=10195 RepID=A0A3M7QXH4_BRAPC|nr:hypothetical protein BpHYR1_026453 [Brachionus plicatilis]